MTLTFTPPPLSESPVTRFDPRWKLAGLLLSALAATWLRTLPATLLAFAGSLLLVLLARLPWRWYLGRVGALAVALAIFVLPLPFLLADGGPSWQWGFLRVSLHGAAVALLLGAKALTVVTLMLVLLASTPLDALLKAARSLHVPGLLVQLALMSYRYLFLLRDELARLRIALRVRGYRNRATRYSYRTLGHVAGTLLVRGYERAERVGHAMRCRGFDGQFRSLSDFRTRPADVAGFLILLAAAVGIFWLDLLWQ
jgi:cobalt/nickel transport system permease protein